MPIPLATAAALGKQNWDAVVDFIAFTPAEIETACTQLAVARGFHVTLLNRARRPALPGTHQITADIADPAATAAALGEQNWDAVVDFIAFTPAEIEQRIALFRGRTGQYVFISSASAYQKPLAH